MELIKRVFMAAALLTVLAPIMNVYAASDVQKSRQGDQVNSGEEEIKEATAQSSIARIVWQELSPEEQKEMGEALVIAVDRGNVGEVRRLLESGVPIDFVNCAGLTALRVAFLYGTKEMIDTLFELSAHSYVIDRSKHEMDMMFIFMQAMCSSRVDLVEALLKSDMFVDMVDSEGRTPLIIAARWSSSKVLGILLENMHMAELIDNQDNSGNTALMVAIKDGHKEALDYCNNKICLLLAISIDVINAETALRQMIEMRDQLVRDNKEKVQLLLQKKADIEKVNENGKTAMYLASNADGSKHPLVYLLASAGADIGSKDIDTVMLLKKSAELNNEELLERLLNAGVSANCGFDSFKALHVAVEQGHVDMVYRLVLAGARVEKRDEYGYGQYVCYDNVWMEKANEATKLAMQRAILERDKIREVITGDQKEAESYGLCLLQDIRLIIDDYLESPQGNLVEYIRKYSVPVKFLVVEIEKRMRSKMEGNRYWLPLK